MQRPWIVIIAGMLSCGGCGGYYTLTAGDHLAAVGQDTPVVVRLQRNDFFFLNLGAKDAVMRFRIGEGVERAAYTDKLGYAGTTVAAGRSASSGSTSHTALGRRGLIASPPTCRCRRRAWRWPGSTA